MKLGGVHSKTLQYRPPHPTPQSFVLGGFRCGLAALDTSRHPSKETDSVVVCILTSDAEFLCAKVDAR